jgi:spoIIIJ-associated protein
MRPGVALISRERKGETGMNTFKEFQAKTVDQAIEDACRFYAVERKALEIDIVSGGSSGIFGLGAKKAVIRAARRRSASVRVDVPIQPAVAPVVESQASRADTSAEPSRALDDAFPRDLEAEEALGDGATEDFEDEDEGAPATVLTAEELVRLETDIRRIMTALLRPIAEGVTLTIDVSASPVTVHIEDGDNSGLIIGRDGQTITALQYLANRIISKSWPQSPRIQLDAGDYRQKQEEQLLSVAQFLSEKAKKSGRVQSTRPLSSFHRRVVHMALQDDRGVETRSKGEGHMKRVLILPVKRGKTSGRPPRRQDTPQARQS